ncbi:MAG: response regulator [Hyphomonadaceae bacterium]
MRVLFVDDDAMNRRVVRDMLLVAGVTLDEAEDGQAGLDSVDREEYSLVLMDLRMPGMDGLTAIRRIRAREDAKAHVPIIVVTADTSLHMRDECLAAGADDVLMKPVAMKMLFKAMGQVVAMYAKRQAASA